GLGDGLEVAAVGSTEEVLRPQPALAKAAHALRPAGKELPVRRHGGGVAEAFAVADLDVEHQGEVAPDRHELQIVVRGRPELDVAARPGVADVEARAPTAMR